MTTIWTTAKCVVALCAGLLLIAAAVPEVPLLPEAPEGINDLELTLPPETEFYHEPVVEPSEEQPRPEERRSSIDFERVGAEMRGMAERDETDEGRGFLGRRRGSGPNYLQVLASLLLVLGLILLLSYAMRRFGKGTPLMGGAGLGKVLGRIYLTPRSSLHFVRVGERVLVIGVSPAQVSLVSQFDAETFEAPVLQEPASESSPNDAPENSRKNIASFLDHLQNRTAPPESDSSSVVSDDEIASLRNEIQRLQAYLKEGRRGDSDA